MANAAITHETGKRYDVIIIGSGMGASAAALRLAQSGRSVLMVERGRWDHPPAVGTGNPYIFDRQSPEDDFEIVGGRSKYYGAALYRFRRADFEALEFESGVSPAWPISYSDLEPYYDEAERLYRVHGSTQGDPGDPHAETAYPHPNLPDDPLIAELRSRLEARGYPTAHIPRGLDYGPGRPCTLCHQCSGHACRSEAKMDAEQATLKPALATGNVTLLAETHCLRIVTTSDGKRADGVIVRRDGGDEKILSKQVIVAAGVGHSATLLKRSGGSNQPGGLGNHSGWLGRGVGGHATGTLFPIVQMRPLGPRHTNTLALHNWLDGDPEENWPYPLGIVQIGAQTPFWSMTSRLKRPLVKAVAQRSLNVFHMTEAIPDKDTGWTLDEGRLSHWTPPRLQTKTYKRLQSKARQALRAAGYPVITPRREPLFWHLTGGAIMGSDPARGVVDAFGKVHGMDNLYVADASVLPSASAVNTGLTIVALALRSADATMT